MKYLQFIAISLLLASTATAQKNPYDYTKKIENEESLNKIHQLQKDQKSRNYQFLRLILKKRFFL